MKLNKTPLGKLKRAIYLRREKAQSLSQIRAKTGIPKGTLSHLLNGVPASTKKTGGPTPGKGYPKSLRKLVRTLSERYGLAIREISSIVNVSTSTIQEWLVAKDKEPAAKSWSKTDSWSGNSPTPAPIPEAPEAKPSAFFQMLQDIKRHLFELEAYAEENNLL